MDFFEEAMFFEGNALGNSMIDRMLNTESCTYIRESHMKFDDNSYLEYCAKDEPEISAYMKGYLEGYKAGFKQCMNVKLLYKYRDNNESE